MPARVPMSSRYCQSARAGLDCTVAVGSPAVIGDGLIDVGGRGITLPIVPRAAARVPPEVGKHLTVVTDQDLGRGLHAFDLGCQAEALSHVNRVGKRRPAVL